jgi:PAS domain S-box-containing protein
VVSSVLGLTTITFVQRLKKAEQAHRASEDRYRTLVENIREVIYRIDQELLIRYVSPAVEALVGYPPEELLGKPIESVIEEADRSATRRLLARAIAGELVHGEVRLRHRDGTLRWARASSRQNRDESGIGLQGVLSDITEEKRAEEDNARLAAELEQARRLEAVGSLAGGVAHDFNNLLAGILANSSLIELDHTGREDRESLKNIEELVNKGAELTRQLLGFARRGKYEILPSDLNRTASDTARLFQRTKQEIALKLELGERLGTVEIDRTQIQQVVLNLLVNAATASPPDGTIWLRGAATASSRSPTPGSSSRRSSRRSSARRADVQARSTRNRVQSSPG